MGLSTTIGPILVFLGLFGENSIQAAFWATLVTATIVRAVRLLIGEKPIILSSTRAASLTAYVSMVLHLSQSMGNSPVDQHGLSPEQLVQGLAAGSVMFAGASLIIMASGMLKLGNVFKMIPSTVTAGIANSTALLLVWLAIRGMIHSTWVTACIAVVMVACVYLWPKLQARVKLLQPVPELLVAVGAALALSFALGQVTHSNSPEVTYGTSWISIGMWPSLQNLPDLGHFLILALPGTCTLALVMILESFTATALMETRVGVRIDANRELLTLGGSNLISALLGGVPSSVASRISITNWLSGGRGQLAAFSSLLIAGVMLVALGPWLLVIPAGMVAGLYLLQAPPLVDPAFKTRVWQILRRGQLRRKGTEDLGFWITFVITVVGIRGNLIWACLLGIGLSCLAVLRRVSSSLDAQWAYLDQHRSHRVRSKGEIANLDSRAHRIAILRLRGHLFFGNSRRLTEMEDDLHHECTCVVIDVSKVQDVDPSGLDALAWLVRALRDKRKSVVLTGVQTTSSVELRRTLQVIQGVEQRFDLDRGLEHCEEQVLQNSTVIALAPPAVAIKDNALLRNLTEQEVSIVIELGTQRNVAKGEVLFRKDELADGVWLLQEGTVSILSGPKEDSFASRLATFGPGQFVGEMGLIDGRTRSATVRADAPVLALFLDSDAIEILVQRHPYAALHITRNIALELSSRVRSSSVAPSEVKSDTSSDWAASSFGPLSRI